MCGIAGIVGSRARDHARIAEAMGVLLAHRGPDGAGVFSSPDAAIAHRRLAIIDPEGGRQPLASEDGSVQVVCNGEIYNYRELRAELSALGHRFTTASDCEAIVHAYEAWGDACVERLRGMFALAVLDLRGRRLLLARDHLGIKPLFWQAAAGVVAFASELPALRRAGLGSWRPSLPAIDLYLRLQYIPSPHTAWEGVQRLSPAHRLVVGFDGEVIALERYWDCPYSPRERSDPEMIGELSALFSGSLGAHLISDVPFGALLSGGADSAGVVAGMARMLHEPVLTFTLGAEGPGDERAAAAALARHVGARHADEAATDDPLALLPGLLAAHGQPFADDSAIPTWQVARLARREVKMVLSGDGGDECFAGYGSYSGWLAWLAGEGSPGWRRLARHLAVMVSPDSYPPRAPTVDAWVAMNGLMSNVSRRGLWRPDHRPDPLPLPEGFHPPEAGGIPPLALAQRVDLRTYLPDCVLAKVDAASMAHGLEVRTPLVDREVATWAMSVPAGRQLERIVGGWRGKRLWRYLIAPTLPQGHLDRPKRGFAAPLASWMDPRRKSGQEIRGRLSERSSPLRGWFADSALARIASGPDLRVRWALVVLDGWLRAEGAA